MNTTTSALITNEQVAAFDKSMRAAAEKAWATIQRRRTERLTASVADHGGHAFTDDGTGRCKVRIGGRGRYPLCGQIATNDVHDW